eukprot:CAMPEP_0194028688 /NCGR_PEP_ID=MMETSP0009_2-20130614/2593_1 /TAXON_ID=210454 /ORGANISM="Grammatophora oceanica, Strain CCMP 410" /LENGTH=366 /DNA_ID=CAMNT_0038668149 /DNA_START=93 /DNA_END=1193 /DNA_ORIENTATION=+
MAQTLIVTTKKKFDLGEFDEPEPVCRDDEKLRWSTEDPDLVLSDWKIEISIRDDTDSPDAAPVTKPHKGDDAAEPVVASSKATYYVHRTVLAAGARKSTYFERLIKQSKEHPEVFQSTSKIDLAPEAAKSFPSMLNFMYFEENWQRSDKDLVMLRYLANYFGIRPMFESATEHLQQDLNEHNAIDYMLRAARCTDGKVLSAATHVCAGNIEFNYKEIGKLTFDQMKAVLTSESYKPICSYSSAAVANFCVAHPGLEREQVLFLTDHNRFMKGYFSNYWFCLTFLWLAIKYKLNDNLAGLDLTLKDLAIRSAAFNRQRWYPGEKFETFFKKVKESRYYEPLPADVKVELLEACLSSEKIEPLDPSET